MNTLQLSWLYSCILHLLVTSAKWIRNIQAAAKVNIFWLNLKEGWPSTAKSWTSSLSTILEDLRELTEGRKLLPTQLLQLNHLSNYSSISKELKYQKDSLPYSLHMPVVRRNTGSSKTNSDFMKAVSLNPNFLPHINGMIGIFPLRV